MFQGPVHQGEQGGIWQGDADEVESPGANGADSFLHGSGVRQENGLCVGGQVLDVSDEGDPIVFSQLPVADHQIKAGLGQLNQSFPHAGGGAGGVAGPLQGIGEGLHVWAHTDQEDASV